jgi:predicted ATP-dependent serine protease
MEKEQIRLSELKKKEFALKESRIHSDYENAVKKKEEVERFNSFTLDNLDTVAYSNKLKNRTEDYMEAAASRMVFVLNNKNFNTIVPFFRKNLILVGAESGTGKSTCTANIAVQLAMHGQSAVIITNEEMADDVYNRMTSVAKGIPYDNHATLSKEQKQVFKDTIDIWVNRGIHVIDNDHMDTGDLTSSLEGLDMILRKLMSSTKKYDAVIIDYFQQFNESKNAGKEDASWAILEKVAKKLDTFKNSYPAPIVLFAQIKPNEKDAQTPFKLRIEGSRKIFNYCTCALEIRANKAERLTEWILHKNRFNSSDVRSFKTGWDKGKYVEYTEEFKQKVMQTKIDRAKEPE